MSTSEKCSLARVSVVVVTRDRASVLTRCLASLESQTHPPDEVIIVAGNEDSCPQSLLDRHAALSIGLASCAEPNICLARNIGLDRATGGLILFIDDDAIADAGWVQAFVSAFHNDPGACAAGGTVLDARTEPRSPEFSRGLIHSSGRQIEVRSPDTPKPRGYRHSVKGCNFALNMTKMPQGLRFDPFFRFAFDEADLVMTLHGLGCDIIEVPGAVVDHLHAPGLYRAAGPCDRDWRTEFASHTMFMLKHTRGIHRVAGWGVVLGRLMKHTARLAWAAATGAFDHQLALRGVVDAFSGVRFGALSHDTDRSSR
ncbi:MAG: glycosyltransferase family 2 protein [Phycisphaerales bacterium]